MSEPEILIIGAGPGGASAAWALAQAGHDVLLIDKAEFPRDKTCGDGLPPMAVQTLEEMGLLEKTLAAGARRIDRVRITGPFGVQVDLAFKDMQRPDADFALTIPRFRFDEIVRQHALGAGAEYQGNIRVESFEYDGDRITAVHAKRPDGQVVFRPKHVVIAVGANMALLRREKILTKEPSIYRAARAYYAGYEPDVYYYDFYFDMDILPGYGWIFASDEGTANIGIGTRDVFWSHPDPTRQILDRFVERRQKSGILDQSLELCSPVKGFPIRVDFPLHRVAGDNWIVIGEAAGLVNPVTGEGIDLAMVSGMIAGRTLHDDIQKNRPNHESYQRELWDFFGPMFNGLVFLRNVLVNPILMDYVVWVMKQHKFIGNTVAEISQGVTSASKVFHPLFVAEFLTPVSPRWALGKLGSAVMRNDS